MTKWGVYLLPQRYPLIVVGIFDCVMALFPTYAAYVDDPGRDKLAFV